MKNNFLKILYRVIPCLVCVMVVISSLTMPAMAAAADWTIDYNDYISDLDVDGDNGIVTVKLPREFYFIKVQDYLNNETWWGTDGKDLKVRLNEGRYYTVTFYSNPNKPFYLGNIPDGATITVKAEITSGTGVYSTPVVYWLYKSWDSNFKWIADTKNYIGYDSIDGEIIGTGTLNKKVDGKSAYAGVFGLEFFGFEPLYYDLWTFTFTDLTISFPVSALTADKIMNDQNQKLMKDINTKLEQQGQTLDSILSGTPEMNDKVDSSVNDMQNAGDKLADLGDSLKVEQPDVSDIKTDLGDLVDFDAVLAFVNPFMRIWDNNSLLFSFLTIVLTLVIVSWVMFGKKG